MAEIRRTGNASLVLFGTITLHPHMDRYRSMMIIGVVGKLAVPIMLKTNFIDRFIESIFRLKGRMSLTTSRRHQFGCYKR